MLSETARAPANDRETESETETLSEVDRCPTKTPDGLSDGPAALSETDRASTSTWTSASLGAETDSATARAPANARATASETETLSETDFVYAVPPPPDAALTVIGMYASVFDVTSRVKPVKLELVARQR